MRVLYVAIILSGMQGVVLAEDEPAPDITATDAPAAATPRWPRRVIDRPLTLPRGLVIAGADVLATSTVSMMETSVVWGATLALGYGINDDFEINAITPNYAFTLNEFEIKGPLDLGIGYKLLRGAAGGKLEVIARALAGYDLNTETVRPIRVGVHAQYNVTPKFAVVSHDIGLGNAGLSIAVDGEPKPIGLTLPIGVGIQPTTELWVELNTALASNIKLSEGENALISDITPLFATGVYNLMAGHLDAFGYLGFTDLQNAGDTYTFGVGLRYYAGNVD
jgi:hypothetical protein